MSATEYPTFRSIPAVQQPSDHAATQRALALAQRENRRLARENEELRQQLDRLSHTQTPAPGSRWTRPKSALPLPYLGRQL